MAAILAKHAVSAFNREKPHSSITAWVDILTSVNYEDEAYDGIPEVVDSINLQETGSAEASRAIRKKIKHGDPHQQYRALVILKALVENCGQKFQKTFADGSLTEALKSLASDPTTNPKVKKKLIAVFASWHAQFKDDPSMSTIAGLYKQFRPIREPDPISPSILEARRREEREAREAKDAERARSKREKEEAKDRDRSRKDEEKRRAKNPPKPTTRRQPFNFEKEKPQVLNAILAASQASNNLVNAIMLVEQDKIAGDKRVQECLDTVKQCRKPIVRYIQLVENEEIIGTLIETNERVINALETYNRRTTELLKQANGSRVEKDVTSGVPEVTQLQERQRSVVQQYKAEITDGGTGKTTEANVTSDDEGYVHPDLQDLNFSTLGVDSNILPAPLRPSLPGQSNQETTNWHRRGSLSDFSDYSSDEEVHKADASRSRDYPNGSDDEYQHRGGPSQVAEEDPFADPFAG